MTQKDLFDYNGDHNGQEFVFSESEQNKTFRDLNLSQTSIEDKYFYKCEFINSKFKETEFKKITFEKCEFNNCDLSMMKPTRSSFIDVNFCDSKVIGINWLTAATPLNIEFENCLISYCNFFGLNLSKGKIINCVALEADFAEVNLSKANLNGTNFQGARFLRSNLSGADFRGATNYAVDLTNNKTAKAIFSLPEAVSLLSYFDIYIK